MVFFLVAFQFVENALSPSLTGGSFSSWSMSVSDAQRSTHLGNEDKEEITNHEVGSEKPLETNHTNPSTTTIATKEEEESGARFFVHVGPIKTGSSSIQCNLQVNPYLSESSYEYMGRRETDRICPPTKYPLTKRKFWNLQAFVYQYILRGWLDQEVHQGYVETFKTEFRNKYDNGINTIFSAEEFCGLLSLDPPESNDDHRLRLLANLLNDIPQSITFQVFYRHHFDRALSYYMFMETYGKQKISTMHQKPMISILDTNLFEDECTPYNMWKFLQDKLIPLLDRAHLEVFNFHGDDLAVRYICSLPDAQAACDKSKTLQLARARPTKKDIVHSDRIATAAWEKDMYLNNSSVKNQRKKAREIIIYHVRNNLNMTFLELPTECTPDNVLSELYSLSVRIGREMLGDEFDENHLESKFSVLNSRKEFCSVNVTAVLEDPEWKKFFRNMTIPDE